MAAARILFSGYAPVHFLCFQPVYERLRRDPDVEVWFSGGFRHKGPDKEVSFSVEGFYDPFGVDPARVLPIERARDESFDVTVCSHLSDTLWPSDPGRTVQIFHGVSFKNFAVREKALRYDLLCLPGRYHAEQYRARGLIREDGGRCLLTGFPKVDRLRDNAVDRDGVLRELGLDPGRPTVLYAPTGGKHNSLDVMGEALVATIGAQEDWNLLVKPHDHPKRAVDWFSLLAPLENERVRVVRGPDVVPLLLAADALLTDASSVAVEYTLLDRPMVFVDVPKLFKNVIKRGAALDLETYGREVGLVAKTPEAVVDALREALAHPARESALRQQMAAHVFHDPGGAAERVASVVLYAAGVRPALPSSVEVLAPDPVGPADEDPTRG